MHSQDHTHRHNRGCNSRGRGFGRMMGEGVTFTMGFGPGMRGGRGPGGGRRGRMFDAGELKLVLLSLLADQPRHGYDLIRAIEERTGGAYAPSPGVVYPTLTLLAEMGLADEVEEPGSRRKFAITEAGRAYLVENQAALDAALARLDALAGPATDPAPVRRAMDNLATVLRHRMREEGVGKSTLLDIAALIDEAASKIERL